MSITIESEALHERVRAFARAALTEARGADTFDAVALAIARHQARHLPGFGRLVEAAGSDLERVNEIPAVPVEAFRVARVAAHPEALDAVRFETSGTTAASRGVHAMRTTATYRELAVLWGRRALVPPATGRCVVVALAPAPGEPPTSSLGFMMRAFMQDLDGRPLGIASASGLASSPCWLASPDGVDLDGLRRASEVAVERGEPLLVLATGFALVLLLDALAGGKIQAPPETVVMPTGGFKGRTREISAAELVAGVADAFGIDPARVVGEYGMTELSSQLYEGTLPGGELSAPRGVFVPPPWLSAAPVDPVTLVPVPDGEVGIARFVDLANVDSAVAIVTQDRIVRCGDGIRLLGRLEGAPSRGCSLAIEELVLGAFRS